MAGEELEFPFHHGDLALSFAGTVRDRGSEPFDRIRDRAALAAWLRRAHLVSAEPTIDAPTFRTAIELREAISRTSAAFIDGGVPDADDIAAINAVAERWNVSLALDPAAFVIAAPEGDPAKAALGRVARAAVELFADAERRARLRRCELASCGAVVLDAAGGRARRWCSMARCGNRVKVSAHRARAKERQRTD
jgi:predicted RNA-binding Zn ribbon-like protein